MFGSVKGLPRFNNYQEAVEFAQNTKGIRGRDHIIPLKNNRRDPDSYRIEMDRHGVVICWLYRTPVLQYFPNSLVVTAFCSQTTNQFINEIAPYWLRAYMQSGQKFRVLHGEGEFLPCENGRVIVNVNPETYQPIKGGVKAARLNAITLNKTRAAESRKKAKGVIELARVTSKIDGYWEALAKSDERPEDNDMSWLKHMLKQGSYRAYKRSWRGDDYFDHYFAGGYPKASAAELLTRLKAKIYESLYDEDECYDYSPAEYGFVPKMWVRVE